MAPLCFLVPLISVLAAAAQSTPPTELYSPLIQQKVLKIAQAEPNPANYPEYTDRILGNWQYFPPDTWTTGFFPTTLYALNTRAKLCGTNDGDTWVQLGRSWSAAEIPLETTNSIGHDVGFVSMPFMEELNMWLSANNRVYWILTDFISGILQMLRRTTQSSRSLSI